MKVSPNVMADLQFQCGFPFDVNKLGEQAVKEVKFTLVGKIPVMYCVNIEYFPIIPAAEDSFYHHLLDTFGAQ